MKLLENGAEVNPHDIRGNTPLHFCCNNGHMDSAALLLIVSKKSIKSINFIYTTCSMELMSRQVMTEVTLHCIMQQGKCDFDENCHSLE